MTIIQSGGYFEEDVYADQSILLSYSTDSNGDTFLTSTIFPAPDIGTTVNYSGFQYIEAGGTAIDTTVADGFQYIEAGGTAIDATINEFCQQNIEAGGTASGTTVAGQQNIEGGGTAIGTAIIGTTVEASDGAAGEYGGVQSIEAGGTAISTAIIGGAEFIDAGGTANGSINNSGLQSIAGTAIATTINGGLADIEAGGTAIATAINSGGDVYNAGTASGTTINSGGIENVLFDGTDSEATVNAGGFEFVYSGGTTTSAFVSGSVSAGVPTYASEYVLAGGTASATSLAGLGVLDLYGLAIGTIVNSTNGGLLVLSGGVDSGTTINSGGVEDIYSGGADSGATIQAGGDEYVYSGGTTTSALVSGSVSAGVATYAFEDVLAGGTASATTLANAGVLVLTGLAVGTKINSGGNEVVASGGTASGSVVSSGGEFELFIGGTASDSVVSGGGIVELYLTSAYGSWSPVGANLIDGVTIQTGAIVNLDVYQSGSIADLILNSRDRENIYSGGMDSGTTINSGGLESVFSGGTASTTTLANAGFLELHGLAVGTTINSGGVEVVNPGGVDSRATIDPGGYELVYSGGTTTSAFVSGSVSAGVPTYAYEYVLAGGTASAASLVGLGVLDLYGLAVGTIVNSTNLGVSGDGGLVVFSGGVDSGTTLNSGGTENVLFGGTEISATMLSGGRLNIGSGGTASGTQIYGSGTFDEGVDSGGQTFAETIYSGGLEDVHSGGISYNLTISGGGTQELGNGTTSAGGVAQNTLVLLGGTLRVYSGGLASGATVSSGGTLLVSRGGTASGTQLYASGPAGEAVYSGGKTFDETIYSGGAESVRSGGISYDVTVSSGGRQSLGISTAAGGTGVNTHVLAGGTLRVFSGGVASGATVASGGLETVSGGGFDNGGQISGGEQDVYGSASAVTVFAGAQVVESGGTATGTTIDGGTMELQSGAVAAGAIVFAGTGGTLRIDGSAMPTVAISGFAPGDMIDLARVSYASSGSATLQSGNILQVAENGQSYDLRLDPAQNFSGETFALSADGSGGTDVALTSGSLFTSGADLVDFNNLTGPQINAINNGADLYDALGGGDTITLPDAAPGDTSVTIPGTTVSFDLIKTFNAGDNAGDTTTITGGDGSYYIQLGAGFDTVTLGDGHNSIQLGNGTDTVKLGNSDNNIVLGAGTYDLTLGSGNNVLDGDTGEGTADRGTGITNLTTTGATTLVGDLNGSVELTGGTTLLGNPIGSLDITGALNGDASINADATLELGGGGNNGSTISFLDNTGKLIIDGTTMPASVISGFKSGDIIDLAGVPYAGDGQWATFFESQTGNNVLKIVEGGTTYSLNLGSSATDPGGASNPGEFQLSADGSGTDLKFVAGQTKGYSTIASIAPGVISPYSSVVEIYARNVFGIIEDEGTGFIIGPHSILTAAHVVEKPNGAFYGNYSAGFGGLYIKARASNSATLLPVNFNSIHVNAAFDPNQTTAGATGGEPLGNALNDFAVINVSQNLAPYGAFTLQAFNPSSASAIINLTGYPGGQDIFTPSYNQASEIGTANIEPVTLSGGAVFAYLLNYGVNGWNGVPGQSGGPLWNYNGANPTAVGLAVLADAGIEFTTSTIAAVKALENAVTYSNGAWSNDNGLVVSPSATADAVITTNYTVSAGSTLAFHSLTVKAGATLTINGELQKSSGGNIVNYGTIIVDGHVSTSPGQIAIDLTVDPTTGVIIAEGHATVLIDTTQNPFTNLVGGTLTGGTYEAIDGTDAGGTTGPSLIAVTGPTPTPGVRQIDTLAATVILHGASDLASGGTTQVQADRSLALLTPGNSLHTSLTTIAAGGELDLVYGSATSTAASFVDPNLVTVNGTLTLDAVGQGASGAVFQAAGLVNTGTISGGGSLLASGSIANTGHIIASHTGQTLLLGTAPGATTPTTITGTGTLDIASGATLEIGAGVSVGSGQTVSFDAGGGETLKLDQAWQFAGKIAGWAIGDSIDFVSASVTSAVVSGTTLTITEAGGQAFSYQIAGQQPGSAPVLQSDGNNGTDVVLGPTVTVSIDNTDVNLAHNSGTVTFAFSAAPASFTLADTTAVGGTLSNLTGSGTTYQATFTAAANTDIANASVAVTADSWQDADGNAGAGGATAAFTVDTVAPSLTSIAASGPGITGGSGDVLTGNSVTLTAQFSAAVTVSTAGGTPFLQLNDGGTASYAGGSGTATLTFVYTVAAGQQTTDLAVTGLSPNGGTIQDAAGNAATLAPSAGVLGGTVQVNEPNTGLEQVTAGNALVINTALTNGKTGTLDADGGGIAIDGAVTNAGTIKAENGGSVTIGGNLTGSGTTEVAEIFSGSEIELQGKFNSAAMAFQNNAGDTGVLVYDHSAAFGSMLGTVAGFASDGTHSDTLDLRDIAFASGVSWSYNQNKSVTAPGGILTVKDHVGDTANVSLLGQYLAAGLSASSASPAPALSGLFNLAADSSTGTLVTTSHHG